MISKVSILSIVYIFIPGFLNVVIIVSKTQKISRGMFGLIVCLLIMALLCILLRKLKLHHREALRMRLPSSVNSGLVTVRKHEASHIINYFHLTLGNMEKSAFPSTCFRNSDLFVSYMLLV